MLSRDPISDKDLASKKYVDDSMGERNVLRFTKTLDNYLKVFVKNDTYNLMKYEKILIKDTIITKCPNQG